MTTQASGPIIRRAPLGFPWPTADPFLFCVHHVDAYPKGNHDLGPAASLEGRPLGQDFAGRDGWRMYHGEIVPGFPQHPHRGFETITLARRGFIDHADSLGATARFGRGDVQWMTAGAGIVHSEMFPLLDAEHPNPVELFQIWLNLPAADKLVDPYFTMLWSETIPRCRFANERAGPGETQVTVLAGELDGRRAPAPPPDSWAAKPEADVALWCIRLDAETDWTLPAAAGAATSRSLYFFAGGSLSLDEHRSSTHGQFVLDAGRTVRLRSGREPVECLLLQGRPIAEPVVHYGPFVMNSREEIEQAIADYRQTGYGGWPWPRHDPVHPRTEGRFARHADGRLESAG